MEIDNEKNPTGNDTDYLEAIEELKKNSVKKEDYNKVIEENKRLVNMVLNGQHQDEAEQKVVHSDAEIDALRKELFGGKELSNLEYCEKALELRDAILEKTKGKTDIFVGRGSNFEPTQNDYYRAENTAEIMKECVKFADGDSSTFTSELMKRCKR